MSVRITLQGSIQGIVYIHGDFIYNLLLIKTSCDIWCNLSLYHIYGNAYFPISKCWRRMSLKRPCASKRHSTNQSSKSCAFLKWVFFFFSLHWIIKFADVGFGCHFLCVRLRMYVMYMLHKPPGIALWRKTYQMSVTK